VNMEHPQKLVGIVWRPDGNGAGAYWDHFTLQHSLGMATAIVLWDGASKDALVEYLHAGVRKRLLFGEEQDGDPGGGLWTGR